VAKFDFPGFARGWFVIGFGHEIEGGEVRPLRYFGQDLVLFRDAAGAAKVLDAFCPHMGAHLGHGGHVEGDGIVCPFHAWKFDGSGECVEIPYAEKIPKQARIPCWPVRERNGMLFVWHDPDKGPPTWEVPVLQGHGEPPWTSWDHGMVTVKTHPREIVENVVDVGHFVPVHGTHVEEISNEFKDHTATQVNRGVAYPLAGGTDNYSLRATYYGPAYQVTTMEGYLGSRLINAHTPIDEQTLHLRFAVSLKQRGDSPVSPELRQTYIDNLRGGFFQDLRIWENMRYRDPPMLCSGDGPIIKLRRWYSQFYKSAESRDVAVD
jgi:3-ketosteroid 9alpha-monooxygenase subunit A